MNEISFYNSITNKIITLRKTEIILDRDLAEMYQVENRALKQAVKRNIERFPDEFMFELNDNEIKWMVSHSVIPSKSYFGGARPFAFTEQGVAMLSAVLKSPVAVHISIKIMKAFVLVRRLMNTKYELATHLTNLEQKQNEFEIITNRRFEQVFDAISAKRLKPEQGIFYDGQIFDAWEFISSVIKSAKRSIILIDNYIDETVLALLSKRGSKVKATIYTANINDHLRVDLDRHNKQYPPILIRTFTLAHDRFLIIDREMVYHIGASLKDLGKKWFAFSRINLNIEEMLNNLNQAKRKHH